MPSAVIIPFPGPRGRVEVGADDRSMQAFVTRYLQARAGTATDAARAVVLSALAHFPGGLPAPRIDVEHFIDFVAGPRLRRLGVRAVWSDR